MTISITVCPKVAEELKARLQRMLDIAMRDIAKFQHDFGQNPAFALQWANTAFRAAAEFELACQCLNDLEAGATADEIAKSLHRYVIRDARPSHSTSQASNLMDEERLAAKSRLLEEMTMDY